MRAKMEEDGMKIDQFDFKLDTIEGFRYRVEDVLRGVTKNAVREARVAELKAEVLASEHLKAHFEDNPFESEVLKHERMLNPAAIPRHLRFVPDYLLPKGLSAKGTRSLGSMGSGGIGAVGAKRTKRGPRKAAAVSSRKARDPLRVKPAKK